MVARSATMIGAARRLRLDRGRTDWFTIPGWRSRVSRYFKYKTGDALLADAEALGLGAEVLLSEDLGSLFEPVMIAGRRVGNRLAIQPMEGCDAEPDGSPGN